jgi:transposase-like protein
MDLTIFIILLSSLISSAPSRLANCLKGAKDVYTSVNDLWKIQEDFIIEAINARITDALNEFMAAHGKELIPGTKKRRYKKHGYRTIKLLLNNYTIITIKIQRVRDYLENKEVDYTVGYLIKYQTIDPIIKARIVLQYLIGLSSNNISNYINSITPKNISISYRTVINYIGDFLKYYMGKLILSISDEFIFIFADGTYIKVNEKRKKVCVLTLVGVTKSFEHKVIYSQICESESYENWCEILIKLKQNGLKTPLMFTADGAMGFWKAASELFPEALLQQCWIHVERNVKKYLPNRKIKIALDELKEIYNADNLDEAIKKYYIFIDKYKNYIKIVKSLKKAKSRLFEMFKLPKELHKKVYTSNLVESFFSTLKNRTDRARGRFNEINLMGIVFIWAQKFGKKDWTELNDKEFFQEIVNFFSERKAKGDATNQEVNNEQPGLIADADNSGLAVNAGVDEKSLSTNQGNETGQPKMTESSSVPSVGASPGENESALCDNEEDKAWPLKVADSASVSSVDPAPGENESPLGGNGEDKAGPLKVADSASVSWENESPLGNNEGDKARALKIVGSEIDQLVAKILAKANAGPALNQYLKRILTIGYSLSKKGKLCHASDAKAPKKGVDLGKLALENHGYDKPNERLVKSSGHCAADHEKTVSSTILTITFCNMFLLLGVSLFKLSALRLARFKKVSGKVYFISPILPFW